jgi:hypothetical protein
MLKSGPLIGKLGISGDPVRDNVISRLPRDSIPLTIAAEYTAFTMLAALSRKMSLGSSPAVCEASIHSCREAGAENGLPEPIYWACCLTMLTNVHMVRNNKPLRHDAPLGHFIEIVCKAGESEDGRAELP